MVQDQPDSATPQVDTLTPAERKEALDVARRLAELGIPIFVAPPDPKSNVGFALPASWQTTVADPAIVGLWRPGDALCAVMGCGLDLVDLDPRNGGEPASLGDTMPRHYAVAATPSGGYHYFVKSLGVGSRDKTYPGVDVKGGLADGQGRGFAFLAPTEKPSKAPEHSGAIRPYRWHGEVDLDSLAAMLSGQREDHSGQALAARVRDLRSFVAKPRGVLSAGRLGDWARQREPQRFDAAERAINDKLAGVRDWDPAGNEGFRTTLMRAALTLGGYVGCGYLEEADAVERLREAVEGAWPAGPDTDDETWIRDGLRDGQVRPFAVYTLAQEQDWDRREREARDRANADHARQLSGAPVAPVPATGTPTPGHPVWGAQGPSEPPPGAFPNDSGIDDPPPPPVTHWIGDHPFDPEDVEGDDQGLAEAVLARLRPALRHGVDSATWLVREAERWDERRAEKVPGWAVSTVARLMPLGTTPVPKEVSERTPEHWRAKRRADFRSSAGQGKLTAKITALVAGEHPSALKVAELDSDPEVLWAGGWPWDLRASLSVPTLAAIDPHAPHLHTASCVPVLGPTPAWDSFLAAVWPDADLRAWAVRVLSVSLAGYPVEVLPILYDEGQGRTGKTSVADLLVDLLGTYGIAANPKLLTSQGDHDSIVYQLKGARLAFIDEGPREGHLARERLKQLSGGGRLTARQMNANPITFRPTHTLVLTANEPPPLTDPALAARLRLLPCNGDTKLVRPARERLADRVTWKAERPGILAKMMIECARWLADRHSASMEVSPASLRADAADIAASQSPVTRWVDLCTVPAEPGTQVADLHQAFLAWNETQPGVKKGSGMSPTAFGTALTRLGYPARKVREGVKTYNYRPLSVLGGGGYGPPIAPPPITKSDVVDSVVHDRSRGTEEGGFGTPRDLTDTDPISPSASGKIDLGVTSATENVLEAPDQPGTLQNPRSDPLSTTTVPSVPGDIGINAHTHTHTQEKGWGENRDLPGTRNSRNNGSCDGGSDLQGLGGSDSSSDSARTEQNSAVDLQNTPLSAGQAPDSSTYSAVTKNASSGAAVDLHFPSSEGIPAGLPEGFDPLAPITPRQKRAWAAAVGCSESQASGQLKEWKRQAKAAEKAQERIAKVAELSGAECALPVLVNRALEVTPTTVEEAPGILAWVLAQTGGLLTLDMENTGYPVGHRLYRLRTVQLGHDELVVVLDPDDPAQARVAADAMVAASWLEAHSGQADVVACAHAGLIDFEAGMAKLRDTAVMARLSDPRVTGADGGLKETAPRILGKRAVTPTTEAARKALFAAGGWLEETKPDTPLERSGWAQARKTGATMIKYAGADVLDTRAIGRSVPWLPDWLVDRERRFQHMTARITNHGAPLDHEHIRALGARHQPERDRVRREIQGFPGTAIENPGSTKQLAEAFGALGVTLPPTKPDRYGRGGGSPCTAEYVLKVMAEGEPESAHGALAQLVLDYRSHNVALNTFIGPYKALCESGDGRVRTTIYTVGTNTGRTSSVRPNLQQLPRQGGFRAMVGADPGFVIVRADFSSVEVRGAGALSGDQTLLESIRVSDEKGPKAMADLHWVVARQAYGPDATKEHRYRVKPGVFCRMYGGGAVTIAEQLGITEREAGLIAHSLDAVTPTYRAWAKSLTAQAQAGLTHFEAYSGRKVWFTAPSSAANYAVQGTCRELLVDALVDRWAHTPWGGCMVLPVHDEVLAWVPAQDAHAATVALVGCMTSSLTGPTGATVRIKAEPDDPREQADWPQDGRWHGFTRWADAS